MKDEDRAQPCFVAIPFQNCKSPARALCARFGQGQSTKNAIGAFALGPTKGFEDSLSEQSYKRSASCSFCGLSPVWKRNVDFYPCLESKQCCKIVDFRNNLRVVWRASSPSSSAALSLPWAYWK